MTKRTKIAGNHRELAAAFDRVLGRLDTMSDADFRKSLVRSGIYTSSGKLAAPYQAKATHSGRTARKKGAKRGAAKRAR